MTIKIRTAESLSQTGWYYKHYTHDEAVKLLQREPVGTFIVRDSSHPMSLYTLSVRLNHGTTSIRILYHEGKFQLHSYDESRPYMPNRDNAVALVDFYVRLTRGGRDYNCRWHWHRKEESLGIQEVSIALQKPKANRVVDLSHLCRLSINRSLPHSFSKKEMFGHVDKLPVPKPIKLYLKDYPYII
jgi:suppressor of cytokine signaling 2